MFYKIINIKYFYIYAIALNRKKTLIYNEMIYLK